MTTPHEQEWVLAGNRIYLGPPEQMICIASFCAHTHKGDPERSMMAAAPDMARALLRVLDGRYCQRDDAVGTVVDCDRRAAMGLNEVSCDVCVMRDALRKAGVL